MSTPQLSIYEFGEFRLDANGRLLYRGAEIVDVTPKALDILLVLVEAGGRVVSKEEIFKRVWADRFVEEANLSYNVFKLRKALSEDETHKYIETLPKRGYRFVAEIRSAGEHESAADSVNVIGTPAVADHAAPIATVAANPPRRRPGKIFAAAILIVLIVALALVFVWYKAARSPARVAKAAAPPPPMSVLPQTSSGIYACAAISPDGKFVSYAQNYTEGAGSIFVRQIGAGTDVQLLESGKRVFGSIAFSPDSQNIYYLAQDEQNSKWTLYRIAVLGGKPSRMLAVDGNMFSLSPDGSSIGYFRDEPEQKQTELIVAALDGSGERSVLTRSVGEMIFDGAPAWSPDGRQIAFAADNSAPLAQNETRKLNLWTLDLATGKVGPLSSETWRGVGTVGWMKDNSGIVLVGSRRPAGNQLYFVSLPGGEAQQITKEFGTYGNFGLSVTNDGTMLAGDRSQIVSQLWSINADGKKDSAVQLTTGEQDGAYGLAALSDGGVVYSARSGPEYDLWIMRNNAGSVEGSPLTSDVYFDSEPMASPDGRTVVFVSDRAGSSHLFRIDQDGGNLQQLTSGSGYDSGPDLSPDGKWIFYASVLNERSNIWKIPAEGGPPVQVTDFESVAPSVSPDGKMIACMLPLDNAVKNSTLAVVSVDDGKIQKRFEVLPFEWHYNRAVWTPHGDALIFQGDIKRLENLWKQDLNGGEPKQLTNFSGDQIIQFDISRDAKHLIASRLQYKTNVVIVKNFKPVSN